MILSIAYILFLWGDFAIFCLFTDTATRQTMYLTYATALSKQQYQYSQLYLQKIVTRAFNLQYLTYKLLFFWI